MDGRLAIAGVFIENSPNSRPRLEESSQRSCMRTSGICTCDLRKENLMGHPQRPKPEERPGDPKRPCGTPGAVYTTRYESGYGGDYISLSIKLPSPFLLDAIERPPLTADLHNALLPVIEKFYRDNWGHFAGRRVAGDPDPLPATYDELFSSKSR
jgi:hypothetical protein